MFCAVLCYACAMMVTNKNRLLARSARKRTHVLGPAQSSMIATGKKWAAVAARRRRRRRRYFRSFQAAAVSILDRIGAVPSFDFKSAIFSSREDGIFPRCLFVGHEVWPKAACGDVVWAGCCCDAEKCNSFNGSPARPSARPRPPPFLL